MKNPFNDEELPRLTPGDMEEEIDEEEVPFEDDDEDYFDEEDEAQRNKA